MKIPEKRQVGGDEFQSSRATNDGNGPGDWKPKKGLSLCETAGAKIEVPVSTIQIPGKEARAL